MLEDSRELEWIGVLRESGEKKTHSDAQLSLHVIEDEMRKLLRDSLSGKL